MEDGGAETKKTKERVAEAEERSHFLSLDLLRKSADRTKQMNSRDKNVITTRMMMIFNQNHNNIR